MMLSGFRNLHLALAQATASVPVCAAFDFESIPRPPVPADVLELAAGAADLRIISCLKHYLSAAG
jgi:hypothetical protein